MQTLNALGRLANAGDVADSLFFTSPALAQMATLLPVIAGYGHSSSAERVLSSLRSAHVRGLKDEQYGTYLAALLAVSQGDITGGRGLAREGLARDTVRCCALSRPLQMRPRLGEPGGRRHNGRRAAGLRAGLDEAGYLPWVARLSAPLRYQLALAQASRPETREDGLRRLRHGIGADDREFVPMRNLALGRILEESDPGSAVAAYEFRPVVGRRRPGFAAEGRGGSGDAQATPATGVAPLIDASWGATLGHAASVSHVRGRHPCFHAPISRSNLSGLQRESLNAATGPVSHGAETHGMPRPMGGLCRVPVVGERPFSVPVIALISGVYATHCYPGRPMAERPHPKPDYGVRRIVKASHKLTPADKLTWLEHLELDNHKTKSWLGCYASAGHIAANLGLNARTVEDCRARLKKSGLLVGLQHQRKTSWCCLFPDEFTPGTRPNVEDVEALTRRFDTWLEGKRFSSEGILRAY